MASSLYAYIVCIMDYTKQDPYINHNMLPSNLNEQILSNLNSSWKEKTI